MAHELEYVVDNALLECSEGTVPMFFHPTPRNIRIQDMKVANASDKTPITNTPWFVIYQKLLVFRCSIRCSSEQSKTSFTGCIMMPGSK